MEKNETGAAPFAAVRGESINLTDSPLLQTLAYVGPSIFGGIALLAGGLLLWLVVSAVLDSDLARAVGIVVFAVLALLSRRYLPALLDTNLTDPFWNRYSRRGLVIGSVFGAVLVENDTAESAQIAVYIESRNGDSLFSKVYELDPHHLDESAGLDARPATVSVFTPDGASATWEYSPNSDSKLDCECVDIGISLKPEQTIESWYGC